MLTREDVIDAIAKRASEDPRKVRKIILELEAAISEWMVLGQTVRFHAFGSFTPTTPAAKLVPPGFASTDDRTKRVDVLPSVRFKPSQTLRQKMAKRQTSPGEGR